MAVAGGCWLLDSVAVGLDRRRGRWYLYTKPLFTHSETCQHDQGQLVPVVIAPFFQSSNQIINLKCKYYTATQLWKTPKSAKIRRF